MKKMLMILLATCWASSNLIAAVTITTSAKTVQKAGGAYSVTITGDGSWTATSDASWLTILQGASGSGAGSCVYNVDANMTADTRIGHLTIGGNKFTVTQYGYEATISPTAKTFTRTGGNGTIDITVDAGITWSVVANDSWITVSPANGMSVGSVTYTVEAYAGVVSRVGSITIGGKTFTITQTGVDVSISPGKITKTSGSGIFNINVKALSTTKWTVNPKVSWISVIDKDTGYGDYTLMLSVNANPSFARRTGTVTIGSATLTVEQEGLSTASLSITPENATASASGAYGNVAVYATPDAEWTAESTASWLTISEGSTGAGNGNIKYVASANPTLSSRVGQIIVTPPHKVIDPDLYRGLVFRILDKSNVEGNGDRYSTYSLSREYDGSFYNGLGGTALPVKCDNSYTISFKIKLSELNRVNRILTTPSHPFWFDENNNLKFYSASCGQVIRKENVWHTLIIVQDEYKKFTFYFGETGSTLNKYGPVQVSYGLNFSTPIAMSGFKFGYAGMPNAGYLTNGYIGDIKFWDRCLTDTECALVDKFDEQDVSEDDYPTGAPSDVDWNYMPLEDNAYWTRNDDFSPHSQNVRLDNWSPTADRFGAKWSAVDSPGTGRVIWDCFYGIFASAECDATYAVWVKVDELPITADDEVDIFSRRHYAISTGSSVSYGELGVRINGTGKLSLYGQNLTTRQFSPIVTTGEWHMLAVVGKSGSSIQMYLDGQEIGNVPSTLTLGYYRYSSSYTSKFILGGWNGAADSLQFFHSALTSAQVRELYAKQKVQKVIHTVTQGVQSAKLNTTKQTAAAEGCTATVSLTLAQGVQWSAKSNNDWITITSDTSGAGSAVIAFTVAANSAVTSRTGSITVAGIKMTVVQAGLNATVDCAKNSFGVESDSGSLWVTTEGGGTWTATSDASWLHVLTSSGIGSGPVSFVVDDYSTTTESRVGTITVAGKKVVVTQQGYELSIDPKVAEVGSNAGAGQFGVAAPIDAVWEAISECDWITIVGSRTGIGDGVIQYSVADNTTGKMRVGRIVISGKAYTITQKTTLPVVVKTIGSGAIAGAGNYNQGSKVTLKATAGAGYVFSHWSGDAVGVTNEVLITVDKSKDVTATFIPESAAEQLAAQKAAQGGFYTRDQIHSLEVGNLVLDVDSSTGKARIGVQLQETSDLSNPNWKPVSVTVGDLDVGGDGTVGIKASATGNAKFFRVVTPNK